MTSAYAHACKDQHLIVTSSSRSGVRADDLERSRGHRCAIDDHINRVTAGLRLSRRMHGKRDRGRELNPATRWHDHAFELEDFGRGAAVRLDEVDAQVNQQILSAA